MSGVLVAQVLADPDRVDTLDAGGWNALICAARAELLLASVAHRLRGRAVPDAAARVLADARRTADHGRTAALWEAEAARRALAPLGTRVVLLKGTAYVAAGLAAGQGRHIGDLDILVDRAALPDVERALIAAGWEWVKPDPYDDAYYRRWMHELPPLIHRERDRMIDVHHTILPPTARPTPDAAAMLADAQPLANGLFVLSPADMVCHAAAHLFADGDLQGGLRNLWDIHRLLDALDDDEGFEAMLAVRARRHGLRDAVDRAVRLRAAIFLERPAAMRGTDALFRRRLLARNGWGTLSHKATEAGFYVRSHLIRMPPGLLARHLWTKWRSGYRP